MPRARHVQPSFTTGEMSPRLLGRSDLRQYQYGLSEALNTAIYPHGLAGRRSGTKFIARTKNNAASRLIPFRFNDAEAYVVELGYTGSAGYMRFFRDGGQVLQNLTSVTATFSGLTGTYTKSGHTVSNGDFVTITSMSDAAYNVSGYASNVTATTWDLALASTPAGAGSGGVAAVPYEIAAPWALTDVPRVRYVQSADTLFLCHPNYLPRKLNRTGADVFELANFEFENGPFKAVPESSSLIVYSNATGFNSTLVDNTVYKAGVASDDYRATAGAPKVGEHIGLRISDARLSWDHGTGTDGTDIGRLIKFKYGASQTFCVAQIYQTLSAKNAFAVVLSPGTGTFGGSQQTITPGTAGHEWYLGEFYGAIDDSKHATRSIATATWGTGTLTVTCNEKHCLLNGESVTLAGMECSGTDVNGTYTVTAITSDFAFTVTTADPTAVTAGTGTVTIPKFLVNLTQEGSSTNMNYPSVPAFFQERLWLGNTNTRVNEVYASEIGNFPSFLEFELESPYDVLDDHAFSVRIDDDQVNAIYWMKSQAQGLMVGTLGAEYVIGTGSSEPVTPTATRSFRQARHGSEALHNPVQLGPAIVFIQRSAERVLSIAYSFDEDQQVADDVSILAEHLPKGGVHEMVFQEYPVGVLWLARDDGKLLGLTYDRAQEVSAWHQHDIGGGGLVESIGVTPEEPDDAVWLIVNRSGSRFVELMQPPQDHDTALVDAWFLDAARRMDRRNTTATTMTYVGGYEAGDGGELTASATAFLGTAADVGRVFRLFTADFNSWVDVEIANTTLTSSPTTKATVTVLADVPAGLQATATLDWAEPSTAVTGLEHLEGQTVAVFADGGDHPDRTVSGGAITLQQPAAVTLIGYEYTSRIKTLPIRLLQYSVESRGLNQAIYAIDAYFWKSTGAQVSFDDGLNYSTVPFREPSDLVGYPPAMKTGYREVRARHGYGRFGTVAVQSVGGLPMNLLQLIYHMDLNDGV